MKPPKSIRNLVNSLLGKKSKSTIKASTSFDNTSNTSLDKDGRHHRSADDLLDENLSVSNQNRLPYVSANNRSRSLPRRSQSCLNVSPSSPYPSEPIYGRHVVTGGDNFHKNDYEREPSRRGQFTSNQSNTSRVRSSASLPRTSSSRSNSITSRRKSKQSMDYFERDEGYDDSMPRTTSWSHPSSENNRTASLDSSLISRKSNNQGRSESSQLSRSSSNGRRRFSSHENLLDSQRLPRLPSAASSRTLTNSKDATEEKLRTCLQVLDRLSAQVKEIKDVSKRVNYVDNKVKHGSLQQGERERRIRELNMAAAASRRLKNMIKTNVEEIPSTRLSSRSSGYESESSNGSRKSSSSPQQIELQRTSRPSGRTTTHLQVPDVNRSYHESQQNYPQSLPNGMLMWNSNTTESNASDQYKYRRTTREDSMSSGYATGSDDGRQNSPNVTNNGSTISNYPMQRSNPNFHQWNQHQYHQQQQQMRQYQQESYDPYSIYGNFQQPLAHHVDHQNQDIYGTYGELYDYAPSSVYDHDIYSNGWYQLPSTNQEQTNTQYVDTNNQAHAIPSTDAYNQGWSQMTSVMQNAPMQHGGLSDLFYDPTTQSNTTIFENIAKEVATGGENLEESTWKSYGSFRYRNGERTVMTTGSANRKRKTVRFSQTVRQRVETEESEMEDSTSVIKGGNDEHENRAQNQSEDSSAHESNENMDSSEIYMWPRQHPVQAIEVTQTTDQQQQKSLPEPIYEFPSGHIESSCMCSDCILARGSCQMQPAHVVSYY